MSKTFPAKFTEQWPYASDYGYDEESYPNLWSLAAEHIQTGTRYLFEISPWQDNTEALIAWVYWLHQNRCRMIGFNNIGYDYIVLHYIFMNCRYWSNLTGGQKAYEIYKFSAGTFRQQGESEDDYFHRKYKNMVKEKDVIVRQIDLFKIYHFDNKNKATSLKVLQINMRSENVVDLPIEPGTVLTYEQRCQILPYNVNDTSETIKFAKFSLPEIKLRENLSAKFNMDMMNHSEGKIGEDIIKSQLVNAGLNVRGKTFRDQIRVADIIFPYIQFSRPEFVELLTFLRGEVITSTNMKDYDGGVDDEGEETKGKKKYPCATVNGFPWQFGRGGMHGSIAAAIVKEDDEYEVIDVDVRSFYPELGIVNKRYPEHLGVKFCDEYKGVSNMRSEYPKKTHPMENMAFKYALNVPYGKSNSKFSFLYDPQYTMTITINGQLLLCMLGEWLMTIPGLTMIQANTDGITFKSPRKYREQVKAICKQWEQYTCLDLEFAYYQAMYIRDVNNYIAHYVPDEKNPKGAVKAKGAYVHEEIPWNKDHSSVIVAKSVQAYLIDGVDVIQTIMGCRDPFDFMIKAKVPRSSQLWMEYPDGRRERLQGTTRYYVAVNGGRLIKIMPPTAPQRELWKTGTHYMRKRDGDYKVVKPDGKRPAKTYDEVPLAMICAEPPDREISLESKWQSADCANASNFNWSNLNYSYYIEEAMKLIDPLVKQ